MQSISIDARLLRSLLVLATVIEARDAYTGGHTWRVSQYAKRLAEKAGLSRDEVFITYLGGLVHDVGKVGVPDTILNKQGPLTQAEFSAVKKHPEAGKTLIQDHPLGTIVVDLVLEHHERYDGRGYPAGLAGEDISLFARIVAIADAFDAMTSGRAYRGPMLPQQAYQIIAGESGRQFDPSLAARFVEMGERGELDHVIGHSADDRLMMRCPECGPIVVVPRNARGGDQVVCAGCRGNYILHAKAGAFEIEWLGTTDYAYIPQPDLDTVETFIQQAPAQVRFAKSAPWQRRATFLPLAS